MTSCSGGRSSPPGWQAPACCRAWPARSASSWTPHAPGWPSPPAAPRASPVRAGPGRGRLRPRSRRPGASRCGLPPGADRPDRPCRVGAVVMGRRAVLMLANAGTAELWTGDLVEAEKNLRAAVDADRWGGFLRPHLNAESHLALLTCELGDLDAAREGALAAIARANEQGWALTVQAVSAHLALARVALDRDEPSEVDSWLANVAEIESITPEPHVQLAAAALAALRRADIGDRRRALGSLLATTSRLLGKPTPFLSRPPDPRRGRDPARGRRSAPSRRGSRAPEWPDYAGNGARHGPAAPGRGRRHRSSRRARRVPRRDLHAPRQRVNRAVLRSSRRAGRRTAPEPASRKRCSRPPRSACAAHS